MQDPVVWEEAFHLLAKHQPTACFVSLNSSSSLYGTGALLQFPSQMAFACCTEQLGRQMCLQNSSNQLPVTVSTYRLT